VVFLHFVFEGIFFFIANWLRGYDDRSDESITEELIYLKQSRHHDSNMGVFICIHTPDNVCTLLLSLIT